MWFTISLNYFEIIYVTINFTYSKISNNADDFKISKTNCEKYSNAKFDHKVIFDDGTW